MVTMFLDECTTEIRLSLWEGFPPAGSSSPPLAKCARIRKSLNVHGVREPQDVLPT